MIEIQQSSNVHATIYIAFGV